MTPFSPNGIGIGGPKNSIHSNSGIFRESKTVPASGPNLFPQSLHSLTIRPVFFERPSLLRFPDPQRGHEPSDLVRGGRAVLRVVLFGKRGNHHAQRAEAIRKFGFQSLFLFAVHFGGSALWRAFSRNRQAPKGKTPAKRLLL